MPIAGIDNGMWATLQGHSILTFLKPSENHLGLADIANGMWATCQASSVLTCCKPFDNCLTLADVGELKSSLVSVASEAGIKQVHTPTEVAHCQAGAVGLPLYCCHAVQILDLHQGYCNQATRFSVCSFSNLISTMQAMLAPLTTCTLSEKTV